MKEREEQQRLPEEQSATEKEESLGAVERFQSFYWQLVGGSGVILIMGILLGVLVSVPIGIAVFLIGCGIYLYFVKDELKKKLKVGYRRGERGWSLTPLPTCGAELRIPARLMGMEVTELHGGDEPPCESLQILYLPETLEGIREDFFDRLPSLSRILFLGTAEQWARIRKPPIPEGCTVELEAKDVEDVKE